MFLLSLVAGLLTGIVDLLMKLFSRVKVSTQTQLCLLSIVGAAFSFPLFLIRPQIPLHPAPWLWLGVTVISTVIANLCLLKAYRIEDISNVSLVVRLSVPLIFLAGVFLFNEPVSPAKILGVFVIISGVFIIFSGHKISSPRGLLYASVTGLLFAVAIIGSKYSLFDFDPYSYIFFPYFGVALISYFLPNVKKELNLAWQAGKYLVLATELIAIAAYLVYLVSIKYTTLSLGNTVYEAAGVVTPVLLGIVLLREKQNVFTKISGAFLIILGIILSSIPPFPAS